MEQLQIMCESERHDLQIKNKKMKGEHAQELQQYIKDVDDLKAQLVKKKRAVEKQKVLKEELELKNLRLEAEKASLTTLLSEKTREYLDGLEKNEDLESKNAKLRKEIIRVARERNDAEAATKDK
jgi:hypothetical protein